MTSANGDSSQATLSEVHFMAQCGSLKPARALLGKLAQRRDGEDRPHRETLASGGERLPFDDAKTHD